MGNAFKKQTVGLLQRRVVQETYVAHVGKEANKLELVKVGFEHDPEAVPTEYTRTDHGHWSTVVLPLLRNADLREVSAATGISPRQLRTLANGGARPHRKNRAIPERYLAESTRMVLYTRATRSRVSVCRLAREPRSASFRP